MCNRLRGGIRLAQTHRLLAANDKTSLTTRCFKQAAKNLFWWREISTAPGYRLQKAF
jgi:hypothetical protein